jgi:hypothetical protein
MRLALATALTIVLAGLGVVIATVLPVWAIPPFVIVWLLGCAGLAERLFRAGPRA